jgi:hypothetical protein
MFFGCKNAPLVPFEPGDLWHVSVLPTLVLARSTNGAGASTAAQSGRTKGTALFLVRSANAAAQLVPRTQAE